jgi:cobalt-zinc-cadmium efflux system outer membrane protein
LHEQVVRLTQERLNFMLAGQFEALLVRQQEFAAYAGYLEAVRDYWLARVELARATGSTLQPSKTPPLDGPALPADESQPSHDHSGHTGHGTPATAAPDHSQHEGHAKPPETAAPDRSQHDGHAMPPKPATPDHSNHEHHDTPAAEPAPPPPDHNPATPCHRSPRRLIIRITSTTTRRPPSPQPLLPITIILTLAEEPEHEPPQHPVDLWCRFAGCGRRRPVKPGPGTIGRG